MSKKVSELIKELDIDFAKLKGYADQLGIEVKTEKTSIDDAAAERLSKTVNMILGRNTASTGANKPRPKGIPIINKEAKAKPPIGKPVIPAAPVQEKAAEEPAKEEPAETPVKEETVKEAPVQEAPKTEPAKEEPAAEPVVKADAEELKPEAKAAVKEEKPAEPEKKKEEPKAAPAKAAPAPVVVEEEEDEIDDLELVAVITAAIAASEGVPADGFVVRSIRKSTQNKWKRV